MTLMETIINYHTLPDEANKLAKQAEDACLTTFTTRAADRALLAAVVDARDDLCDMAKDIAACRHNVAFYADIAAQNKPYGDHNDPYKAMEHFAKRARKVQEQAIDLFFRTQTLVLDLTEPA